MLTAQMCFIMVEEKECKKATSRQRKINILLKANGDHVTNMHITLNKKVSSSSALYFSVDESE